jgi:hypothetical protein
MAATSSSSTSPYSKLMEILSGASIHIPYSILIQSLWKCSLGQPTYPNTYSLFISYSKLMKIPLRSILPPQYIFLIQFLSHSASYPTQSPLLTNGVLALTWPMHAEKLAKPMFLMFSTAVRIYRGICHRLVQARTTESVVQRLRHTHIAAFSHLHRKNTHRHPTNLSLQGSPGSPLLLFFCLFGRNNVVDFDNSALCPFFSTLYFPILSVSARTRLVWIWA